ncbi:AAA family ATPase [bacterium]|nr:AAA family ATPase [bacterium]
MILYFAILVLIFIIVLKENFLYKDSGGFKIPRRSKKEDNTKILEEKKEDLPSNVYSRLLEIVDLESEQKYFNFVINLPFKKSKHEIDDIEKIKKKLNDNFYGLDDLKKEVENFLVRKKFGLENKNLLFYGCPGNGKTTFAKAFAKSIGRELVRISLGGSGGEKIIRGSNKVYLGSGPGRIMQGIKDCGYNNPVVLLDEIDKVSFSRNIEEGDLQNALLELLDSKQNNDFNDHYLDFGFDLSNVLFIATANNVENINPALKDRFSSFYVRNYSAEELNEMFNNIIGPNLIKKINNKNIKNIKLKFQKNFFQDEINQYTKYSYKYSSKQTCYHFTVRKLKDIANDVLTEFIKNNIVNKTTNTTIDFDFKKNFLEKYPLEEKLNIKP